MGYDENDEGVSFTWFAAVVVICIFAIIGNNYICTENLHNSPEYKSGYSTGYNETNQTKYEYAKICRTNDIEIEYSNGYIDGYMAGIQDKTLIAAKAGLHGS